jgi:hypothetical protein
MKLNKLVAASFILSIVACGSEKGAETEGEKTSCLIRENAGDKQNISCRVPATADSLESQCITAIATQEAILLDECPMPYVIECSTDEKGTLRLYQAGDNPSSCGAQL